MERLETQTPNLNALAQQIPLWAREMGFQQTGISDTDLSVYREKVQAWIKAGHHGDMAYMAAHLDKRLNPALLEPGTCRVIVARMDYRPAEDDALAVLHDPDQGYISRYALGRDYHKVVRRRLAALARRIDAAARDYDARYRALTDAAPVGVKALAEKAGLGWIGKHTLLLNREAGSWFFLGEIYTNLPLPTDPEIAENHCGSCRACMTVCPTKAILAPNQLDARRCISYLTIEHHGSIPEPLRAPMGNRIFGCDDCQLFCPWNRQAPATGEADFTPRHDLDQTSLLELFRWTEETFLERTRGSAIRRISYEQWQRNLAVGLGNGTATPEVLIALNESLKTASPLLREHIEWALDRLGRTHPA